MIGQEWLWSLAGGLIIGFAAALYLILNGRILGASGILGGLVDGTGRNNAGERIALISGLIGVPAVLSMITGVPTTHLTPNLGIIVAAGLLVGVGTRLANGCTSGHGVCGISRLAPRGILATLVYLFFGGLALLVFRHWLGVI